MYMYMYVCMCMCGVWVWSAGVHLADTVVQDLCSLLVLSDWRSSWILHLIVGTCRESLMATCPCFVRRNLFFFCKCQKFFSNLYKWVPTKISLLWNVGFSHAWWEGCGHYGCQSECVWSGLLQWKKPERRKAEWRSQQRMNCVAMMFRVALCDNVGTIFWGESPRRVPNDALKAVTVKTASISFVGYIYTVSFCYSPAVSVLASSSRHPTGSLTVAG